MSETKNNFGEQGGKETPPYEPLEKAGKTGEVLKQRASPETGGANWRDGRWRESMPLDFVLPKIYETLKNNQVVILEAETGAGKTTRLPQYLLLEDPGKQIYMSQTRRNAVRWNGKRIASEMGENPGGLVGWRLSGQDPVGSGKTRLDIMVDQSLANRIRKHEGTLPRGYVIIDEAHERGIPTDLLLGQIKEQINNHPNTRVVVTSATIDTKKFSEFFGGAPVISVKGRMFPVSTEVVNLEIGEHHTQGAARAAITVLERFVNNELSIPTADGAGIQKAEGGTVVVLLPGKEDINYVIRSLQQKAEKLGVLDRVEVLLCHAELPPEEMDVIQKPPVSGVLRFVCGTEVLRSSVTVKKTIGVIDSLQIKRRFADAQGVGHLDKITVSKQEADQAKGRAGRTQPGFYMPISFKNEYSTLDPYAMPGILRQPITDVVLQVAALGRSARDFAFIDKPPQDKLEVAFKRLKRIGALDAEEKITEVGELLIRFPLDPETARSLVAAEQLNVLSEAVVAAAIVNQAKEGGGIIFRPRDDQKTCLVDEEGLRHILSQYKKEKSTWQQNKYEWNKLYSGELQDPATVDVTDLPPWVKNTGDFWEINLTSSERPPNINWVFGLVKKQWQRSDQSDFAMLVRAYRAFKAEDWKLKDSKPPYGQQSESVSKWRDRKLRQWCEANFVNYKRVRMVEQSVREIMDELENSPLQVQNHVNEERDFDAEALTKALAAGLTDHIIRVNENKNRGRHTGLLGETILISQESACSSENELVFVGGVRKHIDRRGGTVHFADLAAPVKKEWLKEVMPQLCRGERLNDAEYDVNADEVMETEVSYYGDMNLGREKVPAVNRPENVRLFARWLTRGYSLEYIRNEALRLVIESNRKQQLRAENLNLRIGGTRLKVYTTEELENYLVEKLSGACKQSEVQDGDALYLPPLDEVEVANILEFYPDTVSVLGVERDIQYYKEYRNNPDQGTFYSLVVRVDMGDLSEGMQWRNLPDEGVALPGGRLAEISLNVKHNNSYWGRAFCGSDIPALKEEIIAYLNQQQWDEWKNSNKPLQEQSGVSIPNPDEGDCEIPPVIISSYGVSVIDGLPLMAFGVVVHQSDYGDVKFGIQWFQRRSEAEREHERAQVALERLKNEARERQEMEKLMLEATQLQNRLVELYNMCSSADVDYSIRQAVQSRTYQYMPNASPELRQWILDTKEIMIEAEKALAEVARKKELENNKLLKSARPIVAEGEVLNEQTVYGMACDGEGEPCDPARAVEWRLYSHRDGKLVRHKGYRSSSFGNTFAELVRSYLSGDNEKIERVLRGNRTLLNNQTAEYRSGTEILNPPLPPRPTDDVLGAARALQQTLGSRVPVPDAGKPKPPAIIARKPEGQPEIEKKKEIMTPEFQQEFLGMIALADLLGKQLSSEGMKLPDQHWATLRIIKSDLENMAGRPSTVDGQLKSIFSAIESQYKKKGLKTGWVKKVLDIWNEVDAGIRDNSEAQEYISEGLITSEKLLEGVRRKIFSVIPRIQNGENIVINNLLVEELNELL